MEQKEMIDLLRQVASGTMDVEQAALKLKEEPFEDLGFAKIDHDRAKRQGFPEVIYCAGKTNEQIADIFAHLYQKSEQNIIASRATLENYQAVLAKVKDAKYDEFARIIYVDRDTMPIDDKRFILVMTAGTSDIPVAKEAGLTAQLMGNKVQYCFDVGVAGIHRLLSKKDLIDKANVIIVAAGMEGALASVVGGLANKPVIAVPTSVGYCASFHGLTALLSMAFYSNRGCKNPNLRKFFSPLCMGLLMVTWTSYQCSL